VLHCIQTWQPFSSVLLRKVREITPIGSAQVDTAISFKDQRDKALLKSSERGRRDTALIVLSLINSGEEAHQQRDNKDSKRGIPYR
jgi:hypothetical protein